MEEQQAVHPFDQAIALDPVPGGTGRFRGATTPAYWNMVGPFGGATAAVMLQAVMQHPQRLGTPLALTVNYAAAIGAGAFEVRATPVRTNRSTQHWTVEIVQPDAGGQPQVSTTATAVTALRRDTWSAADVAQPEVPRPADVVAMDSGPARVAWLARYEMRPISGAVPTRWNGEGDHSESRLWLRDAPARPLDFCSLAAMSDMFYPRIWLRRPIQPVPAGTVSITTYFHADAAQLAEVGAGYLLGRAQAQRFSKGFFDQTAHVWSESGALLATSNQIVYFKE